jgi:transcriptional regulator with XRE-family HTH domain
MQSTLSERLAAAMAARGIGPSELARLSNTKQPTISQALKGDYKSLRKLIPVSKALGVRPEWLAEGLGPMEDRGSSPDQDGLRMAWLTEEEHIILEFLRDLPAQAQSVALAQMQTVVLRQYHAAKLAPVASDPPSVDAAPATPTSPARAPQAPRSAVAASRTGLVPPKTHPA